MDMDIGHYLNYNFHYWICYSQIHNTKAYSGWYKQPNLHKTHNLHKERNLLY